MSKAIKIDKIPTRYKLLITVLALVLLIVGVKIIQYYSSSDLKIDYKSVDESWFIMNSVENYDRQTYYNLESIIKKFISSYQTIEPMDTTFLVEYGYQGYSVDEYFSALDEPYKSFLGKKNYIELSRNMMKKFTTQSEKGFTFYLDKPIKEMYKFISNDNMYFCELNTVDPVEKSYIGIILDKENNLYKIFYME